MADKATHCECGEKFGKIKHCVREKVVGDGGIFIVRHRVCRACWNRHAEQGEK